MADPAARDNFAVLAYLDETGQEVLSPVFRSADGVHTEQLAEIWRNQNRISMSR